MRYNSSDMSNSNTSAPLLRYQTVGDYCLPMLSAPENLPLGKYGRMRLHYLKKHRNGVYTGLLLTEKLNAHLSEIDRCAEAMMELLTKQLADRDGITEELKAADQMRWVRVMNTIRHEAEEFVLSELIYS